MTDNNKAIEGIGLDGRVKVNVRSDGKLQTKTSTEERPGAPKPMPTRKKG